MVTAPVSVDEPEIVAAPPTANVLLAVTAPVSIDVPAIVAAPPTDNVLVDDITRPATVAAPLTDSVPATVTAPLPLTENISTAFELACVRAEPIHNTRHV